MSLSCKSVREEKEGEKKPIYLNEKKTHRREGVQKKVFFRCKEVMGSNFNVEGKMN